MSDWRIHTDLGIKSIRQEMAADAYRFAREALERGDLESACTWQKIAAKESAKYLP